LGFSLSAATAIIGVGIVISLELIVSTTIPTVTDVHESYNQMSDRSFDIIHSNINISTVISSPNKSNHDLNIIVRNIGSITLKTSKFDVLIDGVKIDFSCTSTYLFPENNAIFRLFNISGLGTKTVKIVSNNGISDYREYRV